MKFYLTFLFSAFFLFGACDLDEEDYVSAKPVMPAKNARIAFIFPAGAGAMRVSIGILEKMQEQIANKKLKEIVDAAGGVSSGSLAAAALLHDVDLKTLKTNLSDLVKNVFPDVQNLVAPLMKAPYELNLAELEAAYKALVESGANENAMIENMKKNANASTVASKLGVATHGGLPNDIKLLVGGIRNKGNANAASLRNAINRIIRVPRALKNDVNAKLIALAANGADYSPVFFAGNDLTRYLPGDYADEETSLTDALISSAAIPNFITAPHTLQFHTPTGKQNIRNLLDGFLANDPLTNKQIGFDPTGLYYQIFSDQFPSEDLLLVYVGNGAPLSEFTKSRMRTGKKVKNKIGRVYSQERIHQLTKGGRTITLVILDSPIKFNDVNVFNLAGFYASEELDKSMDKAADDVVKSKGFSWTIEAIKKIQGIQ